MELIVPRNLSPKSSSPCTVHSSAAIDICTSPWEFAFQFWSPWIQLQFNPLCRGADNGARMSLLKRLLYLYIVCSGNTRPCRGHIPASTSVVLGVLNPRRSPISTIETDYCSLIALPSIASQKLYYDLCFSSHVLVLTRKVFVQSGSCSRHVRLILPHYKRRFPKPLCHCTTVSIYRS